MLNSPMGKRKKKVAYVVLKGHQTGIFDTWDETLRATEGFKKTADAPMGPEFQGYYTREEAERAWREKKLKPDGAVAPPPAPPKKKARVDAAPAAPAPAIVQPPRGITSDAAAMARYPAHDRRVLEARDLWDSVDAGHGQDDSEPPPPFRGSLTDWEDAKYLKLLIRYGQPLKANPPAMKEFLEEFGYRAKASVTAHVNAFNVGAYKAWRAANGGRWAGFAWVKN